MSDVVSETPMATPDENMGHGTSNPQGGSAQCNGTATHGPHSSMEDPCSLPVAEELARWLVAQIQLPGFVADEDWTPEHTTEFARFCNDENRKQWFLWISKPSCRTPPNLKEEGESVMERWRSARLSFSDELPAHCIGSMLQQTTAEEPSGNGLVFVGKRNGLVRHRNAEEQLLCLSFHGDVLSRLAAVIRGVHIPVLGDNHAWPQSFKRELLRRVGAGATGKIEPGVVEGLGKSLYNTWQYVTLRGGAKALPFAISAVE